MRLPAVLLLICIVYSLSGRAQEQVIEEIDSLISIPLYDEANSLIEKKLKEQIDLKTKNLLQNKKANLFIRIGKLEEAESVIKTIQYDTNSFVGAIIKTTKGFLYLNKARNDLALLNLKQALTIFLSEHQTKCREYAECLSTLSLLYLSDGKTNQALENGTLALQIRQELFGENTEITAASYNDLGLVYGVFDPDRALDYYEKALAIYRKLHKSDHPKIAIANTNIGVMYLRDGLYGDAINNFEGAEKIWEKIYPQGHPNQALALFNLGNTYNQMGNTKIAIAYYEKALTLYQRTLGYKHPSISSVFNQLGTLYLNSKNYEKALACSQAALHANIPSFNDKNITVNPSFKEFYNGKVMLFSLQLKADALEARYYGKTLKISDLKLALATLLKSDSLLDMIRHTSDNEEDKIALGEIGNDIFESGVDIAHALSEVTFSSRKYEEIAFYFSEKSKSAVLQESIADTEAKSFAGIPNELLEKEKSLKAAIVFTNQKLSQKPELEEEKKLRQQLLAVNQQYDLFIKKLEIDFPSYFQLKFTSSTPSIRALQKQLGTQTALISYFMANKKKKLYSFIVTHDRFNVDAISLPNNFNRFIAGFSNSLLFNEESTYTLTARELSKKLIPKLPNSLTNLVFVPTGKLSTLPFEALLWKRKVSATLKESPFLIKRYSVSYNFSAQLFLQKLQAKSITKNPSVFLCAPITFSESQNLDDLPGTEQEVNAIATLFKDSAKMVVTYENASEDKIKSAELSQFAYLHLATHGIVDQLSPELSRIFLREGNNEDGNLFAGEIYALSLPVELAVLSACQTGLGKVSTGEGVIGLSRALAYSGVKNTIVSFWQVNDVSTSQLMTNFYKNLLSHPSLQFNEALRNAKLEMINSASFSSPYFWAPFILIGQ